MLSTRQSELAERLLGSAKRHAQRPSLLVNGVTFSYSDLFRRAQRIADDLQRKHLESCWIGIHATRDFEGYASLLGIILSGKAYVPLSPKQPPVRAKKLWLLAGSPPVLNLPTVLLNAWEGRGKVPGPSLERKNTDASEQMAYLMFTSGSSGIPKGVPVSEKNLLAYLDQAIAAYSPKEIDRFSQVFDLGFDLSVHDMLLCWLSGASLCPIPDSERLSPVSFINRMELTFWFSVPSMVSRLRSLPTGVFASLRVSLFCGEALSTSIAQSWKNAAPNSIIENLYGPTETTIAILRHRIESGDIKSENIFVPIGKPFTGHEAMIDNGELLLAGPQVTQGYLNDTARTEESFLSFPGDLRKWYRTGDLVSKDERENYWFLGRCDSEVKIQGYRVNLKEVEEILIEIIGQSEVVVVPLGKKSGTAEAIMAFTTRVTAGDPARWLKTATENLPWYMIPKDICFLEVLPLNLNGKVDRPLLETMAGKIK